MRGRLCSVSSFRISHFGINPVNGGRPPSDSIVIMLTVIRMGALAQAVARVLIFVAVAFFRVVKAVYVITIYSMRFSSIRLGM